MHAPDPGLPLDGTPAEVNPDSKGCGAVMRSAPFGLVNPADAAFAMAARGAQITHGHPTGYYASGALAAILAYLVAGDSLEGSGLRALRVLEFPQVLGSARTGGTPVPATKRPRPTCAGPSTWPQGSPTAEKVESLGAGWVAEEALAIGVYCALATPRVEDALLLSVNQSGDSDSTPCVAICSAPATATSACRTAGSSGSRAAPGSPRRRTTWRPNTAVADPFGQGRGGSPVAG